MLRSRGWRLLAFGLVLMGVLLALGPASARTLPPPPPTNPAPNGAAPDETVDNAVAFIDRLALIRENRNGFAEAGWVRRWRGPVTVTLEGVAVPGFSTVVAKSLKRISEWTGLDFRLVDHVGSGDHMIIRVRHEGVVAASFGRSDAVCLTATYGEAGQLHRAVIDISERYLDCLDHELMHALGFNNHWHGERASRPIATVLAPRHSPDRRRVFSSWDILAIRTLYRADLPPGTERAEALDRMRATLTEQLVMPAAGN